MWIPLALTTLVALPQNGDDDPERKPRLDEIEQAITDRASAAAIRRHLRRLTEDPHVAGSPADLANAVYIEATLREYGFDVEVSDYEVYLPYPERVALELTAPRAVTLDLREQPHERDKDSWDATIPPYNAYSASGTVEAPVVFAHQGTPEDFEWLEAKGIAVAGKICLIRYGSRYRGLKVREAARRGAVGVLLYSDPDDDGYRKGDVLPEGKWRPPTAVQRGSVVYLSEMCGDPLTPGEPSLPGVERLAPEQCPWLPSIPCLPISARNAELILTDMRGPNVSRTWQGGCPVTYHCGPGPARVKMTVELDRGVRTIRNLVGRLRAPRTSSRYVLVGAHRDGWAHSAMDGGSATALALESMRVLGDLVRDGWEPRYEIRFASWSAEEFALIGSTEWCEEHADAIQRECLAYFNCDTAVSGDRFAANATPDLVSFLGDIAARTLPHDGRGRLLARWAHGGSRAPAGDLGSGSDYTAFICRLGVPALDFGCRGGHGVYHSSFDTFWTMETFIDPEFRVHESMARFLAIAAYRFAGAERPPLEPAAWGPWLESALGGLDGLDAGHREALAERITALRDTCTHTPDQEQLVALHHAVLDDAGITSRPWFRNLLVAPDLDLGYGAAALPDLQEALASEDEQRIATAVDRLGAVIDAMTLVLGAK